MSKLLIPKTYLKEIGAPIIFLAGPIRGAPTWQDDAICYLFSQEPNLIIVSPRWGIRPAIADFITDGDESFFPRQRAWERHYLKIAGDTGVIMFWLPNEEVHDCKKAYGAMTRYELAQASTIYSMNKNYKFCVGSDGLFSELNTIQYDLSIDAPDIEVKGSLFETCDEALKIA